MPFELANFEDVVLRVMVLKDEEKTMRHPIQIQGTQPGSQPSSQLSERMGQQATDVQVQQVKDQGNGQKGGGNQGDQRQTQTASR